VSINKNKEFHKWLSTCPFRICKMDFITHGLTSVSFVWHEEDEEEQLDDKYQSIDRHNEDYFVRESKEIQKDNKKKTRKKS